MNQLETRTRRRRTEEDKAMRYGGSNGGAENLWELKEKRKKKNRGDSEPML